jgi:hypothetical protein
MKRDDPVCKGGLIQVQHLTLRHKDTNQAIGGRFED